MRDTTMRPITSTAPPGGNGTIRRTGRVGDHCGDGWACAVASVANKSVAVIAGSKFLMIALLCKIFYVRTQYIIVAV